MSETTTAGAAAPYCEKTGPTVDDAIRAALAELRVSHDDAEIEVIAQGTRAVPGETVSGGEARVRVRLLDAHTRRGRALLRELLQLMNIPTRITVRRASGDGAADADPPVVLDIGGDDLGLLIGWRGETLRSIQTVVNLMMGDGENLGRRLIIDVERYRVRREHQVVELARRIAHRVKRTGERYTLDPMHAYERRAVHVALADDPGVRTESVGKDLDRSIVVYPTGPAQTGLADEGSAGPRGDGHRPPRREFRS